MNSAVSAASVQGLRPPRCDDRRLWDVMLGIWGYPAILVAHELRFFELVAEGPLTLEQICEARQLKPRPAHALLAVCTSLGLMDFRAGRYSLTPRAQEYLLPSSPYFFGHFYDAWRKIFSVWSPETLREAVLTDKPQGVFSDPTGVFAAWHAEQARDFTLAMHSASIGPAMVWPKKVDLGKNHVMLDVGGGSGAHAIGAVTLWPRLRAIVLDREPICAVAVEMAVRHGVAHRITAVTGDFFTDPFPKADLHFYGMIFHDWTPEQCKFLARKSFASLPPGGRIVVHEMLFNDERTGPFPVSAFNVDMLVAMPGQQYSGREISSFLKDAGFERVQLKSTFGYWSIVTGIRPQKSRRNGKSAW